MTMMIKTFAFGAGAAALAAASPAAAQYRPYSYANVNQIAAQRCTAAVQARLNTRNSGGIFGAILGNSNRYGGRVLSVTRINPNRNSVRVRGLASSGRYAYGPYGVGAYGMLGYNYAPPADLRFKCDVDYRGYIRDVDINRR
jgi:hypothetical protein